MITLNHTIIRIQLTSQYALNPHKEDKFSKIHTFCKLQSPDIIHEKYLSTLKITIPKVIWANYN